MTRPVVQLWLLSATALAAAAPLAALAPASAQEAAWELTPCRVHVLLAIDAPEALGGLLGQSLPNFLSDRVDASIGAAWSITIEPAEGIARHEILNRIDRAHEGPVERFASSGDKLLLVALRATPFGYEFAAREYDRYLQIWGSTVRRECRQLSALREQLFALLWQTVAPLVRLELDASDESKVVLTPRGADLARKSDDAVSARPGDVFLPYLRRVDHEGEVVEDGIQRVPWTVVEVTNAERNRLDGRILSGTRRPLGVRRRGRIEQLAIALRADPQPQTIRLHSRTNASKALVGYEVYLQRGAKSDQLELLGVSNRQGEVVVEPNDARTALLYVKHGGIVLARVPVAFGAETRIDLPLPDDDIRLQAEQRLAALREELIDVVARRTILIARTRQKIAHQKYDEAGELLAALDQLPSRSQFSQRLMREARNHRSEDPQIQRRIDRLMATTEEVVGRYLDAKSVIELHGELRAAREGS